MCPKQERSRQNFFNSKRELIVEWMQKKTKQKLTLKPRIKDECNKRMKCGNCCRVPRWSPILIIYHLSDVQVYYAKSMFISSNKLHTWIPTIRWDIPCPVRGKIEKSLRSSVFEIEFENDRRSSPNTLLKYYLLLFWFSNSHSNFEIDEMVTFVLLRHIHDVRPMQMQFEMNNSRACALCNAHTNQRRRKIAIESQHISIGHYIIWKHSFVSGACAGGDTRASAETDRGSAVVCGVCVCVYN